MSDIRIHKSREIGYNEFGEAVQTEESHVKILSSFKQGALHAMKGAPLSVFICVALHESEDQPGASLTTIGDETGYDRKTVIKAIRFLEDPSHRFVERCGREADGTNRYRPAAYAWFGSDKSRRRSPIPSIVLAEPVSSIHPAATGRGRASGKIPLGPVRGKFSSRGRISAHDDDVSPHPKQPDENHHHHVFAAVRKILAGGGFQGPRLDQLAQWLDEETARQCVEWVSQAKRVPELYREPYGYAFAVYKSDPHAILPAVPEPEKAETPVEIPLATALGKGRAGEVWRELLEDLSDSLDRRTLEIMAQTRVVDWDADGETIAIAVFDPSGMIARIQSTVERTLYAIVGRHCELIAVADPTERPCKTLA